MDTRNTHRSLWIFCLFATTGLNSANAAGLGEAVLHSKLFQPLHLEIPLLGDDAASLEAGCFRVQTSASGAEDLPWVTDARLRLLRTSGLPRLIVTTRREIDQPAMMIGITADCGARVHREYPLLFSPQEVGTTGSFASSTQAATDEQTSARERRAPASKAGQRAETSHRAGHGSRHRSEPPAAPIRARAPSLSLSLSLESRKQDHLSVRSGETSSPRPPSAVPEKTSSATSAQTDREHELINRVDEKISRLIEMEEKIRQLEALSKRLEVQNQRLQILLAKQATPPPSPREFSSLPWLLLLVLGLGSASAFLWLWRKKREGDFNAATEIENFPPIAAGPELELESEALSTADIWPDQGGQPSAEAEHKPADEWEIPAIPPIQGNLGPSSLISIDETIEEHDSAVELAEIMMSFGRIQGAAETLAEYIRINPRQAVRPWVKLLEVYKAADLRNEFDALALKLNHTFNVIAVNWEEFDKVKQINDSLEQMAHITNALIRNWGRREAQAYVYKLLRDNRDGTRRGFPLGIVDDLLMLSGVLEIELGAFHPTEEEQAQMFAPPGALPDQKKPEELPPPASESAMLDLNFEEIEALPPLPEVPKATVTTVEFNLDEEIPPKPSKN